jgi:hypothetical protein
VYKACICSLYSDEYSRREVKVSHRARRQSAWLSILSAAHSAKDLPVHLPDYLKQVSPCEDSLRASLPGENMGPIQEEIRQYSKIQFVLGSQS